MFPWRGCWSSSLPRRAVSTCSFSRNSSFCRRPWWGWRGVRAASRPVIETWMVDNLGPEARLRDAADGITSLGKLAQNIPQLLRDTELIASQLADGGLRLHPESVRAIAITQIRRTRHVRVALWIAAGALGMIALRLF